MRMPITWKALLDGRRQSRKSSSTELNILLTRFLYLRGCSRELIIEK